VDGCRSEAAAEAAEECALRLEEGPFEAHPLGRAGVRAVEAAAHLVGEVGDVGPQLVAEVFAAVDGVGRMPVRRYSFASSSPSW
jgi:hypothetical protein